MCKHVAFLPNISPKKVKNAVIVHQKRKYFLRGRTPDPHPTLEGLRLTFTADR